MGRRERQRSKLDRDAAEEHDRIGATPSRATVSSEDSDEEANEDLSLGIVEKAQPMRATRLGRDNDGRREDGVVCVDRAGEVEKGSARTKKMLMNVKKETKKVVKKKKEITDQMIFDLEVQEQKQKQEVKQRETTVETVGESNPVDDSGNAVLRKYLRGPRYFDPPESSSWGACYNCGESGHMAVDCTSARRLKPCSVCGSFDHNFKQCPKRQDCFTCSKAGHHARDCPDKYKSGSINSRICMKCGDSGHHMFSCRNDYHPDDFKEVSCYVCKKLGHLCCADFNNSFPKEVSCYRCGQLGHTGLSCNGLYGETTVTESRDTNNSCFKCGEAGHFARECRNSSKSCNGLYGETTVTESRDTNNSCFKCGEAGHFARECRNSSKKTKRVREPSTPKFTRSERELKPKKGHKSAPHDLGKSPNKKKTHSQANGNTTPKRQKHRGVWMPEDPPRDYSHDRSRKSGHRITNSTPNGHLQSPQSTYVNSRYGYQTPHFHRQQQTPPDDFNRDQRSGYSGSRFGNHRNGWNNRSYGW